MNAKQVGFTRLALINAWNMIAYYEERMSFYHPDKDIDLKILLANDDLKWAAQYLQDAINKIYEIQNELSQYEKEQTK